MTTTDGDPPLPADTCRVPSCDRALPPAAPVPLCDRHLEVAHDWVAEAAGVTDLLPSPCLLCASRLGVRYPSGWLCAVCEWRHGEVPDVDLAPPRVDVVYYIRFDDRVKIGTTANPHQRLGRLWHDQLLAFERGGRAVERRRHEQFAAQRFGRTEWFSADRAVLDHATALASGQPEPWQLHARWVSEAIALRS
ncbi:GIY-YIG nuclease family protein [Frigoribacterium sp. 2-23]|uniref:GIY-YIG nuclease family protein n=1 Tax=Frigoribacterium sp. 2-23 TaxID=3415006 RepID=UPI003C70438D